jgi:CHASE2 domain-containing sensor protein
MTMWGTPRLKGAADSGDMRGVRRRALIWATLLALLCGLLEFGQPADDLLRAARNRVREHPASGQIVVVGVDQQSLDAIGPWPWPRGRQGELVDRLRELGAETIFFDFDFPPSPNENDDALFAAALARAQGRVTIAAGFGVDPVSQVPVASPPREMIARHAGLATVNVVYDYSGNVPKLMQQQRIGNVTYPSMSAKLARITRASTGDFPIDYAIDPRSVPTLSAKDILARADLKSVVKGRDVVIAPTARSLRDPFPIRGYARMPGVYIHVLGAETLRAGKPRDFGWLPAFFFAFACAVLLLRRPVLREVNWAVAVSSASLLAGPIALEEQLIFVDIFPGLLLLLTVAAIVSLVTLRRAYRQRGTINRLSGLPNFEALRLNNAGSGRILIAARIGNYAQIAAALSSAEEQVLITQIAQRLTVGSREQVLHQGDEGIFAWFAPDSNPAAVGQHLDALQGFFRESINLGEKQVDLAITFGLDADGTRSAANRLGSALVACDEAAAEGLKWKAFDPASLIDASWKLSLLGQLDRAIDSGDFWIAYQAKLDLRTGTIVGAEALARWTHPEKGPISPIDFILAAEQSDRIERLTHFVLNDAIASAARINRAGYPFNVAVNLSTRLIGDPGLVELVSNLLQRHSLEPHRLTLEVTETAAMGTGETNMDTLNALRSLGVCISVDDYGTGLSTWII